MAVMSLAGQQNRVYISFDDALKSVSLNEPQDGGFCETPPFVLIAMGAKLGC